MTAPPPTTPPGWFPDPLGRHDHRWFNGTAWTADVADGGVRFVDPLGAAPGPATGHRRRNGIATAALTCGIIGATVAWMPFVVVLGIVLGVLALVFGILGVRRAGELGSGKAFAITGIVTGAGALALSVVGVVLSVVVYREVEDFIEPGPHEAVVTACRITEGAVEITGTLTNRDDETRDYTVFGRILEPRRPRIDDLVATIDDVPPGRTVEFEMRRLRTLTPGDCVADLSVHGPFPFGIEIDRIND